jgi:GntR family histidine utilization transcriptional repressor
LLIKHFVPLQRAFRLSSKIPRYQQIKNFILDAIEKGDYLPHSQIPTEHALADQFAVSRMTVNKAIRDLVQVGLLIRTAGQGTYVTDLKAESPLQNINNIADEVRSRGRQYHSVVIRLEEQTAHEWVAVQLGVRVGTSVFHSLIVHYEDKMPLQLEERYINPDWAPEYLAQDFTQCTPNEYLNQNCPLTDVEHIVEAIMPDATVAGLLEMKQTEPCLLLQRRTWSKQHLISFAQLTHPGSRYKLRSQAHL